jgi:phage baseplate assembly protein W
MPDASLVWSGDLSVTPAGDLSLADGPVLGQQRVLRRLLTNLEDYTWQPDYGGGLGQFVGQVAQPRAIEGAIRGQLYAEAAVAHQPEPQVTTSAQPDGSVFVAIAYSDAASAETQTLTFSVSV